LGQKIKLKALRFLVNYKGEATVRELSREIKATPSNVSRSLKELEKEGLLSSKRIGRSLLFSVNKERALASKIIIPLFQAEREIISELGKTLVRLIKVPYESLILFGSLARGEGRPESDIDLMIVIADSADTKRTEDEILAVNPEVSRVFGNSISPIIIKKSDFLKKLKRRDNFISAVAKEGETLGGKNIGEIL
jgi:predicted nucleotidyltransferase